jgi:Myb-like DNA-binding domain
VFVLFVVYLFKKNDNRLIEAIKKCNPTGDGKFSWTEVAKLVANGKTAKQCRDRWSNHLRDGIKKGEWTIEEETLISSLYQSFGGRYVRSSYDLSFTDIPYYYFLTLLHVFLLIFTPF